MTRERCDVCGRIVGEGGYDDIYDHDLVEFEFKYRSIDQSEKEHRFQSEQKHGFHYQVCADCYTKMDQYEISLTREVAAKISEKFPKLIFDKADIPTEKYYLPVKEFEKD